MDNSLSNEFDSLQEGLDWIVSREFSLKQFHGVHDGEKWSITLSVDEELEQANLVAIADRARLAEEERLKAVEARDAILAEQKEMALHRAELAMSLPRFGGVGKCGIYSTEGGEYAKATKDLYTGVQTGSRAARQEQWETDEPGGTRAGGQ